ncbi:hypothetical protein BC830DRAFT_1135568 [Chytriomyces sp. MP71]|nr:hypothetical protein BC830DRAFT_1135568 [Chytriomyces sp. MP71]
MPNPWRCCPRRGFLSRATARPVKPTLGSVLHTAPIQRIDTTNGPLYTKLWPDSNISQQADAHTKIPSGLIYISNFISSEQETRILNTIASTPFIQSIRRRMQFYGEIYYHTTHDLQSLQPNQDTSNPIDSLAWLLDHTFSRIPSFSIPPSQILVNEYRGDAGLSCHVEDTNSFGHYILTLSLVNPVWMDLKPVVPSQQQGPSTSSSTGNPFISSPSQQPKPLRILLEPRSMLILESESRFRWMHGITKGKTVQLPHGVPPILRNEDYLRISLTMRYLKRRKAILP